MTTSHQSLHRPSIHSRDHQDGGAGRQKVLNKLYIAATLCSIFFLVEVIGGYIAGSLAILSDASHLFADLASFGVAIVASHLASLPSTTTHTFGLRRAESLAALISMSSLAVVSIGLALEAIRRLVVVTTSGSEQQQQVDGPLMSGIAAIGVVVNIILAFVLGAEHVHMPGASHDHHHEHNHSHQQQHNNNHHGHDDDQHGNEKQTQNSHHDHQHDHDQHNHSHHHEDDHTAGNEEQRLLSHTGQLSSSYHIVSDDIRHHDGEIPKDEENINLKAAYLHVLGDLAQSLAVLIAGIVLWIFPKAQIVDPLCTLLFCVLVFYSTLSVLRSSVAVLLEEIPPQVDWMKVYDAIVAVPDVTDVHDLHIWCISHGEPSLSVHCVTHRPDIDDALTDINNVCQRFGIFHATIQLQRSTDYCLTCTPFAQV